MQKRVKLYHVILYAFFNVKTMLKSIFSIKSYSNFLYEIRILGFKIRIRRKKKHPLYYYKKNNLNITTIPKASGLLRDIQLASVAILQDFDKICRENNIKFWLEFGSLLGAIRHKGFIPWDDDIDIGMMRADYEKIVDIVENANSDIYVRKHVVQTKKVKHVFLRIFNKKSLHVFVDIFPYDNYGQILDRQTQISHTEIIKNKRETFIKKLDSQTPEQLYNKFKEFKDDITTKTNANSDLIWGQDFGHYNWKQYIHSYETIFPLRTIEFEGIQFNAANNPDKYLKCVYGNYMGYPKKLNFGHIMFKDFTEKEIENIKEISKKIKYT